MGDFLGCVILHERLNDWSGSGLLKLWHIKSSEGASTAGLSSVSTAKFLMAKKIPCFYTMCSFDYCHSVPEIIALTLVTKDKGWLTLQGKISLAV